MWLVNSVMSKQWSFNWIYIFGMWAVLQEGTSGRWAKILLMWAWKSIRFLCTFSQYNDNRVHIVSCEYSPSDHSGHYIRTPGWQSHPEGQIQSEQHDECFFFFFLKNEHAPGLTPHLRPWLWPELIKWKLFNHNWRCSGQHQWWLSLTWNWGQFETELMFALGTGLSTQNKWSELPEWDLKIADCLNRFFFLRKIIIMLISSSPHS